MQYPILDILSNMREISEWYHRFCNFRTETEDTRKRRIKAKDEAIIHSPNLKSFKPKRTLI